MNSSGSDKAALRQELARKLIEQNIVSAAQVQLALADQEVSGMTFEEVLLARHWIDEATLERLAPWVKNAPQERVEDIVTSLSDDYDENLRQYRRLMEKILGTSWD
ncbi:MAG TPA: hypothetical protein V6D08_06695 [Candidatus Obscuribacterales bacterium]